MTKIQRTINLQVSGLHIREAEGEEKESRVIEGHAVVFGQRSVNLVPWSSYREVYEVMEPGCITQELINRSDVVLTAFHNDEMIFGRSINGKGTLQLIIDNKGLLVRCELAKTQAADDILELIRRGDITGMSFCYTADEDDNEHGVSYERTQEQGENGKEVWIRHVKMCNGLYDVTIAGHPAYQGTDVSNREAGDAIEKTIEKSLDDAQQRDADHADAEKKTRDAKMRTLQMCLMADDLLDD